MEGKKAEDNSFLVTRRSNHGWAYLRVCWLALLRLDSHPLYDPLLSMGRTLADIDGVTYRSNLWIIGGPDCAHDNDLFARQVQLHEELALPVQ